MPNFVNILDYLDIQRHITVSSYFRTRNHGIGQKMDNLHNLTLTNQRDFKFVRKVMQRVLKQP